jgi:hypothetical protein
MKSLQEKFILDQLNKYDGCEIRNKHIDNLNKVSTKTLSRILNQKFSNGSDMKAIFCLFDTLFLSESKSKTREKGLYNLSSNIQKWIKKMDKLPVNSKEGFVYTANFFSPDIEVIVKVPQKTNGNESKIREYFIGIKSINRLRSLIPTFVYTLGAFLCNKSPNKTELCNNDLCNNDLSKNTAFILYEKIPGDSIHTLLKNDKINFDQWLVIFFQLLLGLEVAQREVRFTHFDLHTENVMIRKNDAYSYNVPLDMSTYSIITPEFIPVIIDFGAASSYIDTRYVGSFDYMSHGMLNFMIPGHDMYKFMTFCAKKTVNKELKTKIVSLFSFYGNDDPYNILNDSEGIDKAVIAYCKESTFSLVANYTPMMLMNWIWEKKEYRSILQPYISITERMQYIPIQYSNIIKEYDNIFNYIKEGTDKAVELIENSIRLKSSYVINKYNIMILEKYNKDLKSHKLNSKIKWMNKFISKYKPLLIFNDMAMLEKVFDIKIPKQIDLDKCFDNLLAIKLQNSKDKQQAVNYLNILLSYQENLKPYLQFYFTILELGLTDTFTIWIKKFKQSDIYLFHNKNVVQNERCIRWSQSLMASIIL